MGLRKRISAVVIIEDDEFRELVRYNLFLDGFKVIPAASSNSGMELIPIEQPEVVLLECSDWTEVSTKLKQDAKTRDIIVLVFTQVETINKIDRILSYGADDCVDKSIEPELLGKIVREKLKKHQNQIKKARKSKQISIVVIDDDAGLRRSVEFNLNKEGFDVYNAQDGPSGLELVKKVKPALILLDIVMPGMDGLEVLSALKYDSKTSEIPVIMLTSESTLGTIDRAYEIGAADYVTKPIRGHKLGETLKKNLKKSNRLFGF